MTEPLRRLVAAGVGSLLTITLAGFFALLWEHDAPNAFFFGGLSVVLTAAFIASVVAK